MDKRRLALIVIIVGVAVFILKLLAYLVSNSVALLSDALESIINIVASVMMYAALIIAARPDDLDHRYGHQKAENISALVEGILIIIAAILIVEATIGRLFDPVPFDDINLGLVISLSATSLNGIMAVVMMQVARRERSMALEGDSRHLLSDVISSVGVVVGLFIASVTGLYILDPLIALAVAALLIKMGVDVLRRTSRDLMDSSCLDEEKAIIEVLEDSQGFIEYHELKTRRSGQTIFMDVHLCVQGDLSVSAAHDLTKAIEERLSSVVPGIVPNIHIEDETECRKHVDRQG